MQRHGIVVSVKQEKVEILLDNSQTENSCTISQTINKTATGAGSFSETNCTGCTGGTDCTACSGCGFAKNDTGLFVVNGNKISALNKSGKTLKRGDKVLVEINEKKIKKQTIFAIIFPLALSVLFLVAASHIFKSETARVLGFFLGLSLGIAGAFLTNKTLGERALPEVIFLQN